ncbi:threonine/serine dehydratase [Actinocrinis puniceicyclus]|uniref:threonine ammonia-lyase n=1 Tax=Actinocrinis puniceicyclus TaxID=977794 RepID=A0A8J7WJH9_9ACTN|nr:threonine/serine dehydratase [Actinocrinis puniceicyclus]MBS2963386.1 threonine/serine dehydratase [Actinocrinis puniceicyclus]
MTELVRIAEILEARKRIEGIAVRTPLLPCPWADADRPLWIKAECLQNTGTFKIRGAVNALASLEPRERDAGVIAVSSGNHGRAVAYAAARLGVDALIVIPHGSAENKVAATRALGATIVRVPAEEREQAARSLAAQTGRTLIHPFDDPRVIAGQGTIGAEIAEQARELGIEVDAILVPVGGGGLLCGIAVAANALMPGVAVHGVEPELAADAHDSLRRGERTTWPVSDTWRTVADALRSTAVGELTWRHLRTLTASVLTVSETAILDAVRTLADSAHLVAEPGGAVGVAAYLTRLDQLPAGRGYVAVVSGGNVAMDAYSRILTGWFSTGGAGGV